jgi:two-component system nitrate/nitrite response regulator NarL
MIVGRQSLGNVAPVSLIIADDHPVVRQGLMALLREHPRFNVVETCGNGTETIEVIRRLSPDLALVDMNMPGHKGLEVLDTVNAERLPTRLVFLAASLSDREILIAVAGGAFGIMLKESAPETLIACLQAVAGGKRWLPEDIVDPAVQRARERQAQAGHGVLTEREREVLLLVADGLSNKEVARRLNIAEGTVKMHLYAIYQKISVNNRTALANWARQHRDELE